MQHTISKLGMRKWGLRSHTMLGLIDDRRDKEFGDLLSGCAVDDVENFEIKEGGGIVSVEVPGGILVDVSKEECSCSVIGPVEAPTGSPGRVTGSAPRLFGKGRAIEEVGIPRFGSGGTGGVDSSSIE